jgi:hypothetical protein
VIVGQLRLDGGVDAVDTSTQGKAGAEAAAREITRMVDNGYGYIAIARSLNARGVPTPTGRGQWWPSSARRHVDRMGWADYMRRYRARQ